VTIADLEDKAREIQDLASANPENLRDSVAELAGLVHDLAGKLRAILAQCGKEQAQ
jgi:HD superfamily phosphohydrolase YqeK